MLKHIRKEVSAFSLETILKDSRLSRLFSDDGHDCALQLWILQIKSGGSIENRIVYGRLLPYQHSNNSWHCSDNNDLHTFGNFRAQVLRLNLYIKSNLTSALLKKLSTGQSIQEISQNMDFNISDKLSKKFGSTLLTPEVLTYRPVSHLLNKDAYDASSLSSPHSSASAFSAAIIQADKEALFCLDKKYTSDLATFVINTLYDETGLQFEGANSMRIGDLELLVFPALDDNECSLLHLKWLDSPFKFRVRFNSKQLPLFQCFQFRLALTNNGQVIHSAIATAVLNDEGIFEHAFELSNDLQGIIDSTELEVYGFPKGGQNEWYLCCRWRTNYINTINFQGIAIGSQPSSVKFDWLEKTTRPKVTPRVKAALSVKNDNTEFSGQVDGNISYPWVKINKNLASTLYKLNPPKSEGQFFQRWGQGDGEGRLEFVEWFKSLLTKYQQHQIIIFDPYFEAAGLGLVLICAATQADYIVFTSLPKPVKQDVASGEETDKRQPGRLNNLIVSCERNQKALRHYKLRIYGLKEGRLHDRYIMVIGGNGLPIAGFNLSNSFQTVAENYPLLITPIPMDVLLKVEKYTADLICEAKASQPDEKLNNESIRKLFDSSTIEIEPRRYESLSFLNKSLAGDVLSIWTGKTSLQNLQNELLKEQMTLLGILKNESIILTGTEGLINCLIFQEGNFSNFGPTWDIIGDLLAHSTAGDSDFTELKKYITFLTFISDFIKVSFNRYLKETDSEFSIIDVGLFHRDIDALLYSSYRPHDLCRMTKFTALSWAEYYSIKFLWWYAPELLLDIAEKQILLIQKEQQSTDVIRLSLLSQIINEISLSVLFNISTEQQDLLIRSQNGLLRWLGFNAIENQLESLDELVSVKTQINVLTITDQIKAYGWMINRAATDERKTNLYDGLLIELNKILPDKLTDRDISTLIDSLRGHMRKLIWSESWLIQDIVLPLLQNGRVNFDDVCKIWNAEMLELLTSKDLVLFNRVREGKFTNVSAFLFANSSSEQQDIILKAIMHILKQKQRILQQPLASTSDWSRWDNALTVSMWTLTFTRWSQYYLNRQTREWPEFTVVSQLALNLATIRTMSDWREGALSQYSELALFLDQADELINAEMKNDS
ncbi:VPA1262 family protein [Serratia fonticola]|uniref:VPA1262 family protein n=1 Tax=Serratia fonticola TaxID=47917 RepID=UPI0016486F82|nr:VPA1262 family protein [Serratia fonticola]MBC3229990.1 hypothetical protein [Serratia fonticola]